MNGTLLLDNWIAEKAGNFAPHYHIIDVAFDKLINKNLFLPPTIVGTIANYLKEQEEQDNDDKVLDKLIKLDKE